MEISDETMRVLNLLLASSGIRIGAEPRLRLRNLDDKKITVYEGDRKEYFSFISLECKKAIDDYLYTSSRYGGKLN